MKLSLADPPCRCRPTRIDFESDHTIASGTGKVDFRNPSQKNWQSELLRSSRFAVLSVFLARGVPKPMGAEPPAPRRAADRAACAQTVPRIRPAGADRRPGTRASPGDDQPPPGQGRPPELKQLRSQDRQGDLPARRGNHVLGQPCSAAHGQLASVSNGVGADGTRCNPWLPRSSRLRVRRLTLGRRGCGASGARLRW